MPCPSAKPFSASKVRCGVRLQGAACSAGQPAEERPEPYSASSASQPSWRSLAVSPALRSMRWSWSAGVQSSEAPKHGASSCVSQPLFTEYVWVSAA